MTRARKPVGRITFVGAGPGDPGLLTLRAVEALRAADVVFADESASAAAVEHTSAQLHSPDGEASDVAKALGAEARAGHQVVRLVAGDPFSDDDVIKEVQAVARTTVPFEVLPGVSADVGVTAYAGVATGGTRTVVDVRSQGVNGVDWETVAATAGTLVLLSNADDVGAISGALVEQGHRPDAAVAVTSAGTTDAQRTVDSTLDAVDRDAKEFAGLVVLTLGAAVGRRAKLSWWESRPLYGWKVLVPRTRDQAGAMSDRLRQHGAIPAEVPTIAVEPPRTPAQMERAVKGLVTGRYEWIVFTSANAVRAIREKFEEFGLDARAFAGVKIACIGEATAESVRAYGIQPELLPSGEQSSEGLLADFPPYDEVLDPINRVLLPRADIATETLAAGLTERGWEVDDVTAYRTVRAAPPPAPVREAIKGGGFDAVCFTSSSTVRNLVGIAGKPHARTVVACIGPKTTETAEDFGLRVDVRPDDASVPALVEALAQYARELRDAGETTPPSKRRTSRKSSRAKK